MKLVIVNQDVGYLFIDLANTALHQYDEVVLLSGSIVELGSRLDERIVVRRIVRYRRSSVFSRFVSWLLGFIHVAWLLRTRFRGYEVVVSSNPPLNTLLPLVIPNKAGLYVLDLYPEALHKTGMLSARSPLVRGWAWLNALAYRRFHRIWALTPSMKTAIEQDYDVEVEFAPAWASEQEAGMDLSILDRLGISDAWVVLYSGNLGREHEVECLLDCASQLSNCRGMLFVIAGEGWKKELLEKRVVSDRLKNVLMLPKLPAPEFSTLLAHAKVGVVTQSLRTADVCIPSKTFNLLASGLPILGIGKPASDFGALINQSSSGRVFPPDRKDEMSEFLVSCWQSESLRHEYERCAKKASESFTRKNADLILENFVMADNHA